MQLIKLNALQVNHKGIIIIIIKLIFQKFGGTVKFYMNNSIMP